MRVDVGAHRVVRSRAVTLIEAVLYISVALGLIIGGIVFYQQASLSAKVNQQTRIMSAIMSEARALYAQQANFVSLSAVSPTSLSFANYLEGERLDDILLASGAVPADIVSPVAGAQTGSRLRTAWGGEMAVRAGQDSLNGYFGVQFLMYGVPSAACVRIGPSTDEGVAIWTDRIRTVAMFGTRAGLGIDFGFAGTGYVLSDMVTACTMAALDGTVVMGFRAQLF